MDNRLRVRHETLYRYARPVLFGEHRAMFRPRDSHDLRLIEATIAVSPQAEMRWRHDVFGNSIAIFDFREPADALRIVSEILIEHYPIDAPAVAIDDGADRVPFTYRATELPDLGRTLERHYPDPSGEIDAWARRFFRGANTAPTGGFFTAMTHAIQDEFAYQRREEIGVRPPVETLRTKSGACRDFALLMMEAARSVGVAAQFVTGYIYDPASDGAAVGVQGAGATHAWTQLYLPGAGWVEYDPTNGIVGNRNLIRVGVARDPRQAVPLEGSYVGAASDFLEMTVDVSVRADPPGGPAAAAA